MTAREPSSFVAPGPDRIELRRGDRLPSIVVQLVDDQNVPIDLTGAAVFVTARRRTGKPIAPWYNSWTTGRQCLIIDAPNGIVYYDLQPADTVTNPGQFDLACLIRFGDGSEITVPTEPETTVELGDQIGDMPTAPQDDRLFG